MQTRITSDMTLADLIAIKKTLAPGRIKLMCDDGKHGEYDRDDMDYFVGINGTITSQSKSKRSKQSK